MRRDHRHFLLDENICGPDVAVPLRQVDGWTIHCHSEHLDRGVPDTRVIEFCGEQGWSLLTSDIEIRFTEEAKEAIQRLAVRTFTLILDKKTNGVQIHSALVAAQQKLLGITKKDSGWLLRARLHRSQFESDEVRRSGAHREPDRSSTKDRAALWSRRPREGQMRASERGKPLKIDMSFEDALRHVLSVGPPPKADKSKKTRKKKAGSKIR